MASKDDIPMIGRYWPQTSEGYLINDTSIDKVPQKIRQLAKELEAMLLVEFTNDLRSFYLRGSVAWGGFIPELSDVDFFALTTAPGFRWETPKKMQLILLGLSKAYGLEIECPFASFTTDSRSFQLERPYLSAQIKCFSLLLSGEDLGSLLPPVKPGPKLMPNLRWYLDYWEKFQKSKINDQHIRAFAKLSLRCAFELVLEREGRYTSSLSYCCAGFSAHYPEHGEKARAVCALFLEPAAFSGAQKELAWQLWEWLAKEITNTEEGKKARINK